MTEIKTIKNDIADLELKLTIAKSLVESKEDEITDAQNELDCYEIDESTVENLYIDMLDECGDVDIAGYSFTPSRALLELDPTAYRVGLSDFVDTLDNTQDDGYKEIETAVEELEEELYTLNESVDEIETDIEDLQTDLQDLLEEVDE